jgi:hypothetical protein
MSKETRRHLVRIVVFLLVSAVGMTSVFLSCPLLAWIVIVISDSYLFAVLLLAALRAEDDAFLDRYPWITYLFPRKTAGIPIATLLFLSLVSGFAGLYVGLDVFRSSKTPLDALYISFFILGFTDYLAEAWLWSACSAWSAHQWSSFAGCTFSHAHLANFHF